MSAALFKPFLENLDAILELVTVVANLFGLGSKLCQLLVVHFVHESWSEKIAKILDQTNLDCQLIKLSVNAHSATWKYDDVSLSISLSL